MGAAAPAAATPERPAGWPLAGSPAGDQRDHLADPAGAPWRDLPERYGPWQTCYKRFARWETDGTWARIEQAVQRQAAAADQLDWAVQVDSSVVRAHQHAAGACKGG